MLRFFAALLIGCWVALAGAETLVVIPPLKARVTDLTGTLSADERSKLEGKLQAFEREKGAQIGVLIVPTTRPEAIEQYSIRVAEQWKLGRKGVDDGALLLVAKDDRKLRIEVGYGLEGALNDATAKRIVSDVIAPRFKEGKFYAGIDAGVAVMMSVIGGEELPPPDQTPRRGTASSADGPSDGWFVAGLFLIFGVGGFLRAVFGRFISAGIIAGIAGVVAFFLLSSLALAGVVALVAFVLSLLAGSGGVWSGGSGGGGWSSSGGGFSGGGGSFGGGGASGDW